MIIDRILINGVPADKPDTTFTQQTLVKGDAPEFLTSSSWWKDTEDTPRTITLHWWERGIVIAVDYNDDGNEYILFAVVLAENIRLSIERVSESDHINIYRPANYVTIA